VRGDGRIFKRGDRFWVAFYHRGAEQRESAGPTIADARRLLKVRMREIHGDRFLPAEDRRVLVSELLDDLNLNLKTRGVRSVAKVVCHAKPVRLSLGDVRAIELSTPMVEKYAQERLTDGKAPATVNRELETLRQAFNLAARRTPPRVLRVPHIPLLRVDNARQGFLSRADFEALIAHIPDSDVRDYLTWFWWTGMRPNEIRQLTWEMLDRESWTLTLDPKAAKTRRGRVIGITGPLREIIERRLVARRLDCTLIFHRVSKGQPGQPVKSYGKLWRAALTEAHLPATLVPYDLRRSALRNLVRAGVDFTVAMKISGHRTRSTFDRYNIVSDDDVRDAITKTAAFVATLPTTRKVLPIAVGQSENTDKTRTTGFSTTPKSLIYFGGVAEASGNRTHRSKVTLGTGRL
jgi:integrase